MLSFLENSDHDMVDQESGPLSELDLISDDSILEQIEPDFIYYDTVEAKREADSVDAYMKYWYEVLDTNSDGEIDDNIINYEMGCGGKVHDSIIEWLEE